MHCSLFSVLFLLTSCAPSPSRPYRIVDKRLVPKDGYEIAYTASGAIVYDPGAHVVRVMGDVGAEVVFIQSTDPGFSLSIPGSNTGEVSAEILERLLAGESLSPTDIQCCAELNCENACFITWPEQRCVCVPQDACPECTGTCIIDYDGEAHCVPGIDGQGGNQLNIIVVL